MTPNEAPSTSKRWKQLPLHCPHPTAGQKSKENPGNIRQFLAGLMSSARYSISNSHSTMQSRASKQKNSTKQTGHLTIAQKNCWQESKKYLNPSMLIREFCRLHPCSYCLLRHAARSRHNDGAVVCRWGGGPFAAAKTASRCGHWEPKMAMFDMRCFCEVKN